MTIDSVRLKEILGGFAGVRVAILGDLMLDRYLWGEVNRISPEAPVPVVEVARESSSFGGAANVAENVIALGASSSVVGVVGRDSAGGELLGLLRDRGVDIESVLEVDARPTTTKTRIIAHSQQVVRADHEDPRCLAGDAEEQVAERARAATAAADVLIVSDYGKGVVTERTLEAAVGEARSSGKVICVDPKESHFLNYVGVTAITPNQKEAGDALGVRIRDDSSLAAVGWELRERLDAECVVITRGEHGMSLFMRSGQLTHLPTVAREVYDVTGAGDTVVSALAVALAAGADMVEASMIANHAAGIVIREVGTASATAREIEHSFLELEGDGNSG